MVQVVVLAVLFVLIYSGRGLESLESDNIEVVSLEIFVKRSCSILIGIIYRPPNTSSYLNSGFECSFNDMLDTCVSESKETIAIGDLNVNYSKNSDNTETNPNEVKTILKKLKGNGNIFFFTYKLKITLKHIKNE